MLEKLWSLLAPQYTVGLLAQLSNDIKLILAAGGVAAPVAAATVAKVAEDVSLLDT